MENDKDVNKYIVYWIYYLLVTLVITILLELGAITFTIKYFLPSLVVGFILLIYIIAFNFLEIAIFSTISNIKVLTIIYSFTELVTAFLLTLITLFFSLTFLTIESSFNRVEFIQMAIFTLIISIITYSVYKKVNLSTRIEKIGNKMIIVIFNPIYPPKLSSEVKKQINSNDMEKILTVLSIIATVALLANSTFSSMVTTPQELIDIFNVDFYLMTGILSIYVLNIYLLLVNLRFDES